MQNLKLVMEEPAWLYDDDDDLWTRYYWTESVGKNGYRFNGQELIDSGANSADRRHGSMHLG